VVDIATERADGARIERIVLEVGALTAVFPDALQFCFAAATEGTCAAGATLDIVPVAARGECRACGAQVESHDPLGSCECGGRAVDWSSGDQLRIKEMEVR
jgi:hydrogenase nickel incorporation protein HypA/HybF